MRDDAEQCRVSILTVSIAFQIFKLADLTDNKREFAPVLATLRELYGIAEGKWMTVCSMQRKTTSFVSCYMSKCCKLSHKNVYLESNE